MSKEIMMQTTVDFIYKLNPAILDGIFRGREYEKITLDKEEEVIYYIIKDES